MAEDKFEQIVIEKLESVGWYYLSAYSGVTVERLYDHWRDILNANNRARLEDNLLSDDEFEQVKLELTKNKSPKVFIFHSQNLKFPILFLFVLDEYFYFWWCSPIPLFEKN